MIKKLLRQISGLSLVMVVFAMMVLAVLGWTLAGMFSAGFQSNLGTFDSERALQLAEAGVDEARWLLKTGSAEFDQDSDSLHRKLDYGEYNVSRENSTLGVNITSTGYIPAMNNYLAMRRVKTVFIGGIGMNAISGGYLFDWHNALPISVEGTIISANYYGNDGNDIWNETTDIKGVPQPELNEYDRVQGESLIPDINMTWYYDHQDTEFYEGDQVFYTYKKTASGTIVYVKGNVEINLTGAKGNKLHEFTFVSIVSEGDIYINGSDNLKMTAHVETPSGVTFPNLAAPYGNITMNCDPCGWHEFDGLVHSQTGIINLTNIKTSHGKAMALMGNTIVLNGDIDIRCKSQKADKYIDLENGFNVLPENATLFWQED